MDESTHEKRQKILLENDVLEKELKHEVEVLDSKFTQDINFITFKDYKNNFPSIYNVFLKTLRCLKAD